MSNELTNVRCSCGDEYPADSYDAGFIDGSGMCQNCDAALPPKDICTCPSGDGSLRHPCPAHPAVEQAGGDERAACNLWIAEQQLCQGSDISLFKLERNGALVSLHDLLRDAYQAGQARAALAQPSPAQAEQPTADDYEEVLADHRRLVREMDVLLNGEACAAKQAMLCDLVSQVEAEVRKSGQPLLVSAERYRWLRNDDNWGADDSEGQGTSKWANLGELSGTDFDAYLDQLRGSNPVMDIDPEHSKAIAKRGRDAIVAQAEGAPVIGCLCGMPMTEGRHSPGGCTSLEEFAPNPAQAQSEQAEAERPIVSFEKYMQVMYDRDENAKRLDAALAEVERLRQFERICEGLPQDAIDGGWTVQGIRCYAKRLEDQLKVALARVAELEAKLADLEKQEPIGWFAQYCETPMRRMVQWGTKVPDCAADTFYPLYAAPVAQAQHGVPGKYDDVLLPFLKLMEHELHANAGKGDRPGWLQMDRKTALLEIYYHLGKLQKATRDNDPAGIVEYAADVANMAMMLVDVCRLLAAAPGKEGV